jgi:hypothetical protein
MNILAVFGSKPQRRAPKPQIPQGQGEQKKTAPVFTGAVWSKVFRFTGR